MAESQKNNQENLDQEKAPQPDGIETERLVEFKLTEQELAEKAKEAGKLRHGLNQLLVQFSEVSRDWKNRIKKAEQELINLELVCHEGKEQRSVTCLEVLNDASNAIEYYYNGELVETRAANDNDRQKQLDFPNKKTTEDYIQESEQSMESEVADIINQETKIKTKRSSIDDSFGNGHTDMSGLYDVTETP